MYYFILAKIESSRFVGSVGYWASFKEDEWEEWSRKPMVRRSCLQVTTA